MIESVFELVKEERQRQDAKWGLQSHPANIWSVIIGEEYGEVCQEIWNMYTASEPEKLYEAMVKYKTELVHMVAVGVAALEQLERMHVD